MSVITPQNKLSQSKYHAKYGLKKLAKNSLYISLIFGQVLWPVSNAMAAPDFASGNGVEHTGSNEYTVTDNRAIARWQSFVLDETETIKFLNQDGIENSILLNLVTSEIGSKIAGELNAKNIQFILVDPSGINIAGSAKVDVSGLVLSTAGVSVPAQGEFKENGNLLFDSSSNEEIVLNPDANIVLESDATLNLNNKLENVVLIGKDIQNDANIKASGLVAMLATDNATLNLSGSNILGVSFDASKLISDIKFINNGSIEADKVFLTSLAANQAININKNITANQIVISGDKIQLASNITKNNENGLLKIGKLSSENASIDINLDAASELTIGSNSALSGFDDSQISVKANTVNVESETYTKATIKNNNKITLGGFTDITDVQSVSFTNNQNNGISTNSSALLTDTKNSLKTRGVTFSGIAAAELGGKALTGSDATDSFVITTEGITANDIAITNLNKTIDANGSAKLSGASDAWQLTENKKELGANGYTFTGLTEANLGNESLKSISTNDKFHADGVNLTANNILISTANKNIITGKEIKLSGDWHLTGNDKQLSTGASGYILEGVSIANFDDEDGTSLSGASMSVFEYMDEGYWKYPIIKREWVELFSLSASGITLNNLTTVNNANRVKTNMDASLVGGQELGNSLNIKDIQFNGVNNADLGGKSLTGSTGYQDSFEITFQGITANGIAVEDLNTTIKANGNAELSGADNNTWTISGLNKLTGADGQENEKTYTFTGLGQVAFAENAAVLNGRGSDTFEFQSGGLLEAASMNFETAHLKQVNNTHELITNVDASLQSTNGGAIEKSLETHGIVFTGINTAKLDGNTLIGSSATDSFVITSEGITANDIAVKNLNTTIKANGDAVLSGVDNNTWTITADKVLKEGGVGSVGGYVFTGLDQVAFAENAAVLNGRGSDTFEFQSGGLLEAASMSFETAHLKQVNNTNKVVTHADAFLQSDDNNAVVSKSLKTNGVIFTGVNTADLGGKLLTGSSATDSFEITSQGIKANGIAVEDLNTTIRANGKASLLGAEDDTWLLTGVSGELKSQATDGYTFTGLTDADLVDKGLQGSVEYNRFTLTGENALTAADIAFTGVNTVAGNANNGEVTTNANASLTADKNALTTQKIEFIGIKTADLGGHKLTASAEQNAFNVTGEKALTAADINFTGVSTVAGKDNKGTVITNADASLTADAFLGEKENALNTQSITFTGIKTADLGGQTLIGSKSHDSFKIHTNGSGVNANGIEIVNLDRTINVNGAASLSGAQNNTWQLTNTTNTLEDSRDNGFIFIGVNAANLQDETLNASAAQNKFDITGAQKLTVADIDFSNVAEVNAYDNKGYVITNNVAELTDGKNQLKTQGVIINGVDQAYLRNNTLTASTAQNSFNVTGSKALTVADIDFTGVTSVVGDDNQGQVITGADANLETDKHALTTQNITFTGINKAALGGNKLTASTEQNSFNVTGSKALTAADIEFTGVTSVVGDDNQGQVITGADANLETDKHALTTQGIGFTGIGSAALGGNKLTASTEQNSFSVTGSKALTAADIDFTEVASVVGSSNQGQVTTGADANLETDKHALTTQNI